MTGRYTAATKGCPGWDRTLDYDTGCSHHEQGADEQRTLRETGQRGQAAYGMVGRTRPCPDPGSTPQRPEGEGR